MNHQTARTDEKRTGGDPAPRSGHPLAKLALVLAVVAAVAAFGLIESRLLPEADRRFEGLPSEAPALEEDFPLPEGDHLMGSEAVLVNGVEGYHLRAFSDRSPRQVVDAFAERLAAKGYTETRAFRPGEPLADRTFFARLGGRGYALLGWRDEEGRAVGVTAFRDPRTLGSRYYVSRSQAPAPGAPKRNEDGDVPGRDIEGVVRPPAATREFCIDRPGRHPSMMSLYESTAPPSTVAAYYQAKMPALRWEQPVGSAEVLSENADGHLLSFRRGQERCLVHIVGDGDRTAVTLVYRGRLGGR